MLAAFIVFSMGALAETNEASIHSIVRGKDGEPHLVKFNSGAVKFIEQEDSHLLARFEKKLALNRSHSNGQLKMLVQPEGDFEPTLVPDTEINAIFQRMNPYLKRKSECSDRAHVWAWDEFQRSGIKSEKAFLLLTDTYIKRNRYKWWFHVAPMYTTTSGQKIVMDHQFLDGPVTFTQWKNFLVFSKRECVTDFRFLDYNAGADQTQDCYTKFEPMYYFIPGDIGARENGRPKTGWNKAEVNAARSRAFFKGSI